MLSLITQPVLQLLLLTSHMPTILNIVVLPIVIYFYTQDTQKIEYKYILILSIIIIFTLIPSIKLILSYNGGLLLIKAFALTLLIIKFSQNNYIEKKYQDIIIKIYNKTWFMLFVLTNTSRIFMPYAITYLLIIIKSINEIIYVSQKETISKKDEQKNHLREFIEKFIKIFTNVLSLYLAFMNINSLHLNMAVNTLMYSCTQISSSMHASRIYNTIKNSNLVKYINNLYCFISKNIYKFSTMNISIQNTDQKYTLSITFDNNSMTAKRQKNKKTTYNKKILILIKRKPIIYQTGKIKNETII